MNALRSVIFNLFFFTGALFWSLVLLPTLLFPAGVCTRIVSHTYGWYVAFIERHILGLKLEIRGEENIPKEGAYILAAKHQSAYETLKLPYSARLGYPAIILKKELTYLPIYGWYFWGMGQIAIDRGSPKQALDSIVRGCRERLSKGRSVIIFPEGTRVPVGVKREYKAGIAKIYRDVNVPILPMALNSGVFWGRNAFFKKPGTVVFEFLPVIPAGLPPLKMMEELEKSIEAATDTLVAASQQKTP